MRDDDGDWDVRGNNDDHDSEFKIMKIMKIMMVTKRKTIQITVKNILHYKTSLKT